MEMNGFVTAYYEESQDPFAVPDISWSPRNATGTGIRPAHYYSYNFMKSRLAVMKQRDPYCMNGASSNVVSGSLMVLYLEQHPRISRIGKSIFDFCHRPLRRNGIVFYRNDAISPQD
jgi:hypothetical protein